ncbi:hypothetical protein Hanom_Chr04g00302851 [Helianthus anomalus]
MVFQVVRISAFSPVLSFYKTTVSDSSCFGEVTLDVLLDKMNFICPYACWKRLYM